MGLLGPLPILLVFICYCRGVVAPESLARTAIRNARGQVRSGQPPSGPTNLTTTQSQQPVVMLRSARSNSLALSVEVPKSSLSLQPTKSSGLAATPSLSNNDGGPPRYESNTNYEDYLKKYYEYYGVEKPKDDPNAPHYDGKGDYDGYVKRYNEYYHIKSPPASEREAPRASALNSPMASPSTSKKQSELRGLPPRTSAPLSSPSNTTNMAQNAFKNSPLANPSVMSPLANPIARTPIATPSVGSPLTSKREAPRASALNSPMASPSTSKTQSELRGLSPRTSAPLSSASNTTNMVLNATKNSPLASPSVMSPLATPVARTPMATPSVGSPLRAQTTMGKSATLAVQNVQSSTLRMALPTVNPCSLQCDKGNGSAQITRYYYTGRQCSAFNYRGRGGNENNFKTLEACKQACMVPLDFGQSPTVTPGGIMKDGMKFTNTRLRVVLWRTDADRENYVMHTVTVPLAGGIYVRDILTRLEPWVTAQAHRTRRIQFEPSIYVGRDGSDHVDQLKREDKAFDSLTQRRIECFLYESGVGAKLDDQLDRQGGKIQTVHAEDFDPHLTDADAPKVTAIQEGNLKNVIVGK